jgi:hypothetical protein
VRKRGGQAQIADIRALVAADLGAVPDSSIRSSVQLQLERVSRGTYRLRKDA